MKNKKAVELGLKYNDIADKIVQELYFKDKTEASIVLEHFAVAIHSISYLAIKRLAEQCDSVSEKDAFIGIYKRYIELQKDMNKVFENTIKDMKD